MELSAAKHSREHVTHVVELRVTIPYHVFAATDVMKSLPDIDKQLDGEPPF